MLVQIGKWGASHAIRIPKEVVEVMGLKAGQEINITTEGNKIVIQKHSKLPTYAELIESMDPKNQPPLELDFVPIGAEIIDDEYSGKR